MSKHAFPRRRALQFLSLSAAAPFLLRPRLFLAAEESNGVSRLRLAGTEAKILATTDLHFFSKTLLDNGRTLRELKNLVRHFGPDLLLLNGDVWYNNPHGHGERDCAWVCERMGELGVPWVYVRGNHDQADDFAACEHLLAGARNSLYAGQGRNSNYRVDLVNAHGQVRWRMLIVNDAAPVLGFKQAQIEWLRNETARIRREPEPEAPALLFGHVPIAALAEPVRQEAASGIMKEKISSEGGLPQAVDALRETGIIRAAFFGHDHLNNFRGETRGIHLEYLRATGYGGYGNLRLKKGATWITLSLDRPASDIQTRTVFADGAAVELEQKPSLIER